MKKLIPLLLCIALLAGCAATYDGPTEEKSVIGTYTVTHYYSFFDWEEEHYTDRAEYSYDIYGNRVRLSEYRDGELQQVTTMRYDENGNEISRVEWDYTGLIPLPSHRREMTYDDQNRILTWVSKNGWGIEEGRSTYVYDDANHTMTWSNSESDRTIYYYDENGLELRAVSTGVGGSYETIHEYDDRGNRIGWTSTKDGANFGSYEARFDEQNRQIWGGQYDEYGNLVSQTTYVYDDEAHTKTIHRPDGWIRVEYCTPDGRPYLIEDFDENGKLTMRQTYEYLHIQVPADRKEQ